MEFGVLKAIFEAMEQGVVFIDDQNRIAYCNPAAERIRGIQLDRVFGQSILDCHLSTSHSKVLQIIEDLKSGKDAGRHRMNIQMVSGKFYDNTYSAVRGPRNEYWGALVVSQEVTERKKAEDELKQTLKELKRVNAELKHLGQMKDDFFSNVGHELKTPMTSVMGYIGMLLNGKVGGLTDQQRKFLDISYRNLLKLGKNIDNLFDLAELGVQRDTWTFEAVDLCRVINFSCSTVEPLAKEHQITLEMHLPLDPVPVRGVEDKLNQLFDNLLTNAIKYNRQGGRIYVDLQQDEKFAYARIMDTGIGISHQSLKEVFTRHYKQKLKPLGNFKALGIGLSLVQEIVTLHHGEIHLESELSKGTTVTLKLPKFVASARIQHPSLRS